MAEEIRTCYRHPDRRAGVICQRCDRPICPSCMITASVGFHCPECARAGRQKVVTARSLVTQPVVTQVIIAINAAVFLVGLGEGTSNAFAGRGGFIGRGGLFGPAVANGQWYRLITSGFLHAGLIHVALNMLLLWVIGQQLEHAFGRLRFAVLYGTSLLAGSLGVLILQPNAVTVGASGAVFGLLGAAVASLRSQGVKVFETQIGMLVVINLVVTFGVPGISIGGHLGGLAGGFAVGWLYSEWSVPATASRARALWPVLAAAVLGVACFVAGLLVAGR